MDAARMAQVLDYMREDPDSDRAKRSVQAAVGYLSRSGVKDDGTEEYWMAVKALALSLNDNTPIQKEGNKIITQLELDNIGLSW